jgi:hypothetical protein
MSLLAMILACHTLLTLIFNPFNNVLPPAITGMRIPPHYALRPTTMPESMLAI